MRRPCLAILVLALAHFAAARDDDGTLGLVRTPNNGMPAMVLAGENFEVDAAAQATLHLAAGDGTRLAMYAEWNELPGGRWRAVCTVPASATPGAYALEAAAGENQDVTARAVYVMEEMPAYYVIAHLTDTHVGSNRHPRSAGAIFADLIAAVNESETTFAAITGDLTESGEPDEFRAFLDVLDTCAKPTFVVPGNHDRAGLHYAHFFGPMTYRFRFGDDGYLAFDTKDFIMADELGGQDADLQRFRRELKASRWTVGLTHRYVQMMGMRSQLTLFVDNPLDALLFGHYHSAEAPPIAQMPWGKTLPILTPAAVDGHLRYIDMTARGPLAREPERLAETGAPQAEGD
jgi:predicted phosphodiesterase